MDQGIVDVLHYWFGEHSSSDLPDQARNELWFGNNAAIDKEIANKFEPLLLQAIDHELDHWCEDAHGRLALIIILDQFSRNIYRGTARAFSQDEQALALTWEGYKQQIDQELSLIERVFFYLPFEHAENLTMQSHSVNAFQSLLDLSLSETHMVFQNYLDYAVQHYRVIERFGRFPHRNKILGRESAPAELEYLRQLEGHS